MSATLMQVLDTTIVNVALPHMQGSLGATPDEISWVLTSYLVASAIVMPLTGFFTDKFGRRKYLLICISGFIVASGLCGAAQTLTEIVAFRILQGLFGASLVPLSQAIMTDVFPPEERGSAMAIWGMGVMVGPILGPTLGGYLTEVTTWRWNFYINLPVGILSFLLAWYVVPDTEKKTRKMDWFGLSLISIGIAATQYFFDRGNHDDWFQSPTMCFVALLSVGSIGGFLYYCLKGRIDAVFDLRVFKDLNFTMACLVMAVFGLGLYGTMVIMPLLLEDLLNYPVIIAGLVLAPRGISSLIGMMFVGRWVNRYDPRLLVMAGMLLSMLGTWACTLYNLNINPFWIIWPLLIQGFGLSLVFVPISTIAFSTLSPALRSEAAGLYSLIRTLGSSIGISIVITYYTRHVQAAWNQMGGSINPYNPQLTAYLQAGNLSLNDPSTLNILARELGRQAQMVSFINAFGFISMSFLVVLPLIFLMKDPRKKILTG